MRETSWKPIAAVPVRRDLRLGLGGEGGDSKDLIMAGVGKEGGGARDEELVPGFGDRPGGGTVTRREDTKGGKIVSVAGGGWLWGPGSLNSSVPGLCSCLW